MQAAQGETMRQHLIDPEICIRCNTCEATCPIDAVTHDDNNYVVDAAVCDHCLACLPPCPTGAIDNWRTVSAVRPYSVAEQFEWDELPEESAAPPLPADTPGDVPGDARGDADTAEAVWAAPVAHPEPTPPAVETSRYSATVPPWSAAHPYTNLYGPRSLQPFVQATVAGNFRVTEVGRDYDTHQIVLDFGAMPFPVLEGQSIGIIPPGQDVTGRPHHPRQYSVASARNGERPGYNNLALTVKRVLEDHDGNPVRGLASNYLCDLSVGDRVQVTGPFGASFLMPNHPRSSIVMICTGTGSAPMRAMTEWRRRLRRTGRFEGGRLMLFFGARTPQELPYFGPLQSLPEDFIDINLAFSRIPGEPRRYVQDRLRERGADIAALLADPNACFYVCGLRAMEEGVVLALRDVADEAGLRWDEVGRSLVDEGRLHLETY